MSRKIYIEVTNTLANESWSGIQRVTVELIRELMNSPYDIRLIKYCNTCKSFTHLRESEQSRIWQNKKPNFRFSGFFDRIWHKLGFKSCKLDQKLDKGAMFLDLEAAWHNPLKRHRLLPDLLSSGITPVQVHYDLIPVLFPNYIPEVTRKRFEVYLNAHIQHTQHFICISDSSKSDLAAFLEKRNAPKKNLYSFRLGTDFMHTQKRAKTD